MLEKLIPQLFTLFALLVVILFAARKAILDIRKHNAMLLAEAEARYAPIQAEIQAQLQTMEAARAVRKQSEVVLEFTSTLPDDNAERNAELDRIAGAIRDAVRGLDVPRVAVRVQADHAALNVS